jgi:hypothetical protein
VLLNKYGPTALGCWIIHDIYMRIYCFLIPLTFAILCSILVVSFGLCRYNNLEMRQIFYKELGTCLFQTAVFCFLFIPGFLLSVVLLL